jgi:hypothetical protein
MSQPVNPSLKGTEDLDLQRVDVPNPHNPDIRQIFHDTMSSELSLGPAGVDRSPAAAVIARPRPLSTEGLVEPPMIRVSQYRAASRDLLSNLNKRHERLANTDSGIVKNPYYRYEGGPFNRIITFLANCLKLIERLIVRQGMTKEAPDLTVSAAGAQATTQRTTEPRRGRRRPRFSLVLGHFIKTCLESDEDPVVTYDGTQLITSSQRSDTPRDD